MTLKELVLHYRETGEFLPEGYEYMFDYMMDNIQGMYDEYIDEFTAESPPFSIHVMKRINDWQVDTGFTRDYSVEEMDKFINETDETEIEMIFDGEDNESDDSGYH